MSYIKLDKTRLINLEYSLSKEKIRSNRRGAFACTTIINCNTRKYHGLLVVPQPGVDNNNHVLLSSIDETVIQRNAEFNLGMHKYPGNVYSPKGHKYIRDFSTDPIPSLTYRVGGVVLKKELLFHTEYDRILIIYTLLEANSPTKLRFRPFLAFRNVHSLTRENINYNNKYTSVKNGIKVKMYPDYSPLVMQFSKSVKYTHIPGWFYNIEYFREQERGYDYQEDLYVPGYFDVPIRKGESFVFSAGLDEIHPSSLKRMFNNELSKRIPRNNFENCLINSAEQFIVKRARKTGIIAGFPWFGQWGRDTFISLPGLTLVTKKHDECKAVIDSLIKELEGPLFPNIGIENKPAYNSVDAPLWFFWTIQQYAEFTKSKDKIWKEYGKKMKLILDGYSKGTNFNIKMEKNGLISAGRPGVALTWMDAIINGKPVTPRSGKQVEINALWYNALMFSIEVAELAGDKKFVNQWTDIAEKINISFTEEFWDKDRGYLADYVDESHQDWSVRPNQVFALSLPYSPINNEIKKSILMVIEKELLTPRGLRTLSPKNPEYKGKYTGNQAERDRAYHQGTVWPWLLGFYAEGYLRLFGKSGIETIKALYRNFEEEMVEAGIGSISEVYDGDPPHNPGGSISQAWSVSELLRINWLIKQYSRKRKQETL